MLHLYYLILHSYLKERVKRIFMKKLILCGIVTMSFFANIKPASNTQDTWSYQWFSSAIADDDDNSEELEHILIEHKREDEKGGSGGGGSGNAPPGGGGNGQGGGTSDEERAVEEAAEREARRKAEEEEEQKPENRAQCIARSNANRNMCRGPVFGLHTSNIRDCSTFDFSGGIDVSISSGLRLPIEIRGGLTVTVHSFEACTKTNDSVRDGFLNDCETNHSVRILSCPAE
jgi:ADP-ribose pyrophosphatase YjhB (NUDIX family)